MKDYYILCFNLTAKECLETVREEVIEINQDSENNRL
jgi:hypothetical protein